MQSCSHAVMQSCSQCSHEVMQSWSHAVMQSCRHAVMRSCGHAVMQSCSHAIMQSCNHAIMQSCNHTAIQSCSHAVMIKLIVSNMCVLRKQDEVRGHHQVGPVFLHQFYLLLLPSAQWQHISNSVHFQSSGKPNCFLTISNPHEIAKMSAYVIFFL